MATYIMALKISPDAKKEHPDLSHSVSKSLDVFSENRVVVSQLFATLGRYDYLAVFDTADSVIPFKIATEINKRGVLQTETWPVIPYDEYTRLIG